MSTKKKGQLTANPEWMKHLRKIGKRFLWEGERLAERKFIDNELNDIDCCTQFRKMNFPEIG